MASTKYRKVKKSKLSPSAPLDADNPVLLEQAHDRDTKVKPAKPIPAAPPVAEVPQAEPVKSKPGTYQRGMVSEKEPTRQEEIHEWFTQQAAEAKAEARFPSPTPEENEEINTITVLPKPEENPWPYSTDPGDPSDYAKDPIDKALDIQRQLAECGIKRSIKQILESMGYTVVKK